MKNQLLLLACIFLLGSCQNQTAQNELAKLKTSLAEVKTNYENSIKEISALKAPDSGELVHIVYFNIKSDADKPVVIQNIKKLEGIPVLKNLDIGTFKDLNDSRALSDYTIIMQMNFANEVDYKTYQEHPIHLTVKKSLKNYLAGKPATYDYILE